MGLPVQFFIRSVWRTQHRPIVEDSEDVDVAEAAVIVVVDAAVVVVVDAAKTRKNGFPSPNLDVSLKMAESRVWRKSICSLSPSKNSKSSISSWDPLSKTKSSKSCLYRNRPVPVNVPALRPSLPSATTMDTSVWALSAPKKWPPPSVVPLSWPSSQSFPFVVVSGVTKLDVPIPFLARSLASAVLSGRGSSPLPEVLASCLHLFLRSFCRWLVSRIVTPPLVDLPELLETSLRPLMPLLLRPTPT